MSDSVYGTGGTSPPLRLADITAIGSTACAVEVRRQPDSPGCRSGSRGDPAAASRSQSPTSQAISWALKPMTSSRAGSSGEPNVSYSSSTLEGLVDVTVARGIAAVSRT